MAVRLQGSSRETSLTKISEAKHSMGHIQMAGMGPKVRSHVPRRDGTDSATGWDYSIMMIFDSMSVIDHTSSSGQC